MDDLEIIEYLLNHPQLEDTVQVTDSEIRAELREHYNYTGSNVREFCEIVKTKTGRKVTRIGVEIFVRRTEKLTVAQRNAYHFKNLTETR